MTQKVQIICFILRQLAWIFITNFNVCVCMVGEGFPHINKQCSRYWLGVLQFSSTLTLSTQGQHQIPQRAEPHKAPLSPISNTSRKSKLLLGISDQLTIDCKFPSSFPLWILLICQRRSHNFNILLTILLIYYKKIYLGNSQMEEMHSARYGERAQSFCVLWQCHCPQIFTCSSTWKPSKFHTLGFL